MARKHIYETDEVKEFVKSMSKTSIRKYIVARQVLAETGYLRAPLGEKIAGCDDMFAIRIATPGNERFFYCYAEGDFIAILHGYRKTTARIPRVELEKALALKKAIAEECA